MAKGSSKCITWGVWKSNTFSVQSVFKTWFLDVSAKILRMLLNLCESMCARVKSWITGRTWGWSRPSWDVDLPGWYDDSDDQMTPIHPIDLDHGTCGFDSPNDWHRSRSHIHNQKNLFHSQDKTGTSAFIREWICLGLVHN